MPRSVVCVGPVADVVLICKRPSNDEPVTYFPWYSLFNLCEVTIMNRGVRRPLHVAQPVHLMLTQHL